MSTQTQPTPSARPQQRALGHLRLGTGLALAVALSLDLAGAGTLLALGIAPHEQVATVVHGSVAIPSQTLPPVLQAGR
jgi:hypothetical protein